MDHESVFFNIWRDSMTNLFDYFSINTWTIIGLFAQFLYFLRFIIQWLASEREKKTVIPKSFWFISIAAAIVTFIYAIKIKDLVFTLGSLLSLIIYSRNLVIHLQSDISAASKTRLS